MRASSRRARAGLCLTLLVSASALTACSEEALDPTQLVVVVDAEPEVAEQLSHVLIETYDPDRLDADDQPLPGGSHRFAIASERTRDAEQLPFSFGLLPDRSTRVLLVVTGLRDGTRVIEQKGQVEFRPRQRRVVYIYLRRDCYEVLCGEGSDEWLRSTCNADDGACGAVPPLPSIRHVPDTELDSGLAQLPSRDAGMDATLSMPEAGPDDSDDAEAGVPSDSGPEPTDGEAGPVNEAGLDAEAELDAEVGRDAEVGTDAEAGRDAGPAGSDAEAGAPGCGAGFERDDAGACVPRDYCRGAPCGAGHRCVSGASDYTCICAATHFQADAKRCVPRFVGVGAGLNHMCGWRSDASLVCWGENGEGQLARAPAGLPRSLLPLVIAGLSDVIGAAGGVDHTCALGRSGQVSCWGWNENGELGDGTRVTRSTPRLVSGLASVTQIVAGHYHTCARRSDGSVWCWGANVQGQLGRTGGLSTLPVEVPGITGANRIAAGGFNTCALLGDNSARCWGHNIYGQLGNNVSVLASGPVTFASNVADISVGEGHICALTRTPAVLCAGHNHQGQLGVGSTTDLRVPTAVMVPSATAITLGAFHSCALQAGGVARCWGDNEGGRLGNGTTIDASSPVAVSALSGATMLVAGGYQTCALRDGDILCWGLNFAGALGNGTRTDAALPVRVIPY